MATPNTEKAPASAIPGVRYLSRAASAKFLSDVGFPTSPRTLEKLAHLGGGPVYRKFGRRTIYAPADLITWAEGRASLPRRHTSEAA